MNTPIFISILAQKQWVFFFSDKNFVASNSGIFVASKYPVADPHFLRFSLNSLDGRSKHAAKGAFSFDIQARNAKVARIWTTHMGHSEIPGEPTHEEKVSRQMQIEAIIPEMVQVTDGRAIILTGDFNLDTTEYQNSAWKERFDKAENFQNPSTWGGDYFCATMVHKKPSLPCNLDYTLVQKETIRTIDTELVCTDYDEKVFKKEALSDHMGLFSTLTLLNSVA